MQSTFSLLNSKIHPLEERTLSLFFFFKLLRRDSLVAQWLRLCTPNAGGPGSILDQGTRSHILQLGASLVAQMVKNLPTGDLGLIPELGRFP